ncbi:MAG: ATP-binding cassette domain-containing protein [Sulfurovaceae bacterium]|nr:ATP-binding cassette domain-containing protein [Sulfurovaceae bacterium]
MKLLVKVKDLVTILGGRIIHDGLSFSVNEGEIFGILGGSGSGKSTVLRAMTLLGKFQKGNIEILGYDLGHITDEVSNMLRLKWGVLFQSGALFTSLTVAENIEVILKEHTNLSPALINDIIRLKIRMVGLPDYTANLYPRELSGGMKKRASLARALAMDPKILFLDEPTSGLDPIGARAFDELIVNLRNMLGLTVIMITHDPDSIQTVLDRMVIIGDGKSLIEGNLEQVKISTNPLVTKFFTKLDYNNKT